jgi:hypothetical protein
MATMREMVNVIETASHGSSRLLLPGLGLGGIGGAPLPFKDEFIVRAFWYVWLMRGEDYGGCGMAWLVTVLERFNSPRLSTC